MNVIVAASNQTESQPIPVVTSITGMDICPLCGSDETKGESFNTEGDDRISQEMSCLVCESEWMAYYTPTRKVVTFVGKKGA
ncbi:hypothetical protein LCGC14_0275910 [marine sediment metagenome]|uniref:Uncharacterized protein n=1 Tax=marine sediment metagenome TaxID=412755 RepID=A0A0F9U2L9_9ZZZZ